MTKNYNKKIKLSKGELWNHRKFKPQKSKTLKSQKAKTTFLEFKDSPNSLEKWKFDNFLKYYS